MGPLKLVPVNQEKPSDLLTVSCPRGRDIVSEPAIKGLKPFQFGAAISKVSIPSSQFLRARVAFTWPLGSILEWDQAGIVFLRPHRGLPEPSATHTGDATTFPSYAKVGLEHFQGSTYYTVSASQGRMPDWSLWPLEDDFQTHRKATIEIVKYGDYLAALAVTGEGEGLKKQVYRIVQWCFADLKEDDAPLWIGLFVSHPDFKGESKGDLTIQFTDFELETVDEGTLKLS